MKSVKTDDFLVEAWKQQLDAGMRLMELQVELTRASALQWAAYWSGLYAVAAPQASSRAGRASAAPLVPAKVRKKRAP